MKKSKVNKRVKELCDSIKNHDAYKEFFVEIDRDIKRSMEREKNRILDKRQPESMKNKMRLKND